MIETLCTCIWICISSDWVLLVRSDKPVALELECERRGGGVVVLAASALMRAPGSAVR